MLQADNRACQHCCDGWMQRKASQSRRSRLRLLVILAIIRALLVQCGF